MFEFIWSGELDRLSRLYPVWVSRFFGLSFNDFGIGITIIRRTTAAPTGKGG